MKTRDAKNNPVTAVLVSVLVMFLLSCLFLLLLAALLYKFDLSESAVKVGIVVIYIVSGVIGGFFMGKIMKTQKSNLQKGNKNTQSHVSVSKQARKKTSTKKVSKFNFKHGTFC